MSQDLNSFRPTESVQTILDTLREQGLEWMVDEIAERIREGRALRDDEALFGFSQSARSQIHATVPLDEDEQLRIALMTITRYTVETYDTWNQSVQELRAILKDDQIQVVITQPESDNSQPLFPLGYFQEVASVVDFARRWWPDGEENFDQIIAGLRSGHQ